MSSVVITMGIASRTSRPAIRARRIEMVSMVFSHVQPAALFAASDPLAERDQNAERDEHPDGQDDDECNDVHGILLSNKQSQCMRKQRESLSGG